MNYQEAFRKLEQNPSTVSNEAVRILCKIADNILKSPNDSKIRTLQKNNSIISTKILNANGGKECLRLMGFSETETTFTIGSSVSLKVLDDFKNAVFSWNTTKQKSVGTQEAPANSSRPAISGDENNKKHDCDDRKEKELCNTPIIRKTILPPLKFTYSNPFLRRVETYCHNVLQYEDKNLQERTRKLIPITILEENAQNKLRNIQEFIKKNKLKDCELSLQDTLILELLQWFKEEFFEWVDSPECESCGDETSFSHMSTDSHLLQYTDRVELHRCKSCHQFTPFPRYNDLNILLETRRGRCGEWANTFTLCCRAMGWDSRFIVDEGDHVWTEVYSMTQKRWIHCDPCENICDTPLVYESGWHKSISYIMAYSIEDIQDVTWRYSSDHKAVLKRRNNCSETELLNAILKIRSGLQKNLSGPRKNYLTNRTFMELVEFLTEKKPNDSEQKGRSSGSDVWRLARGEIQEPFKEALWLWRIDNKEIMDNTVTLRYSSVLDKYEYLSGGKVLKTITGWHKGAFKHSGVFRKEEKDWKMVYLARKENAEKGLLSWKFDLSNSQMILDTVELTLEYDTFENGVVDAQICDENTCLSLPKGEKMALFDNFTESKELTVTASLSGGKGDVFWQHAQLFRQSTTNESFNFSLTLTFMK